MLIQTLIVLMMASFVTSQQCHSCAGVPQIKYGNYCGKDHYSNYAIEPIDAFDRVCQIHDICVTARGLLDCYCNEQLYWMISYLKPFIPEQQATKDYILRGIYASILGCKNHELFDIYFYVSRAMGPKDPAYLYGFNYITFFDGTHTLCSNDKIIVFSLNDTNAYDAFTKAAFNDPLAPLKLPHQTLDNSCGMFNAYYTIAYNYNNVTSLVLYIRDMWKPA